MLAEDHSGGIWLNTIPPHAATPDAAGGYQQPRPLSTVTADDIQNVEVDADGVVWMMSNRGLFRFTGGIEALSDAAPIASIRRVVRAGDEVVFGGAPQAAGHAPSLPYRHGRLRLEFAAASYRPGVQYQYRLEPTEGTWSGWSEAAFTEYTQLDEGAYAFHVRSRASGSAPGSLGTWRFRVAPPWYRTALAWLGWFGVGVVLVGGYARLRTHGLRRQTRQLEEQVNARTAELRDAISNLETAQLQVREKNRELEVANAQLDLLSRHDALTGLWNRRHLDQALADEWNRARRHGQSVAFLLMDLDHFKDLNDRQGHAAGDDCLRRVARILEERVGRSGEIVARYGGEEFGMLLPGQGIESARQLAERLRQAIEELDIPHHTSDSRRVTASFGVASVLPEGSDSPEQLVERADKALYRAKAAGRNSVRT
jgi:diguanylate cyclase (GGDEF)-like protein